MPISGNDLTGPSPLFLAGNLGRPPAINGFWETRSRPVDAAAARRSRIEKERAQFRPATKRVTAHHARGPGPCRPPATVPWRLCAQPITPTQIEYELADGTSEVGDTRLHMWCHAAWQLELAKATGGASTNPLENYTPGWAAFSIHTGASGERTPEKTALQFRPPLTARMRRRDDECIPPCPPVG